MGGRVMFDGRDDKAAPAHVSGPRTRKRRAARTTNDRPTAYHHSHHPLTAAATNTGAGAAVAVEWLQRCVGLTEDASEGADWSISFTRSPPGRTTLHIYTRPSTALWAKKGAADRGKKKPVEVRNDALLL